MEIPSIEALDRISCVLGDITRQETEAIVNAANPALAGGGGVDGAIHRAAGPELLAACGALSPPGCPTGQARITPGFDLPARWVIHAVGPIWQGGGADEEKLLAAAYRNSVRLAGEKGCADVAFPAISCGVYGYPHEAAARIALESCARELPVWPVIRELRFVLFSADLLRIFERVRLHLLAQAGSGGRGGR